MPKLDDLLFAMDFVSLSESMENEAYLCRDTGEIFFHSDDLDLETAEPPLPDDIANTDRYVPIPHKYELGLGLKRLAQRFANLTLPLHVDEIDEILRHRGASHRFKSFLEYRGQLQKWYEFEAQWTNDAMREWCTDNAVEISD